MDSLQDIYTQLKAAGYTLDPFEEKDEAELYAIFKEVVDSGCQFPYASNSLEEFHRQFFSFLSQVFVCHAKNGEVIGGFYIRPNFSGRSGHISNCAYMIKAHYRGKGLGTLLVKASLHLAKLFKFEAMQFNMVLSRNKVAIRLYQKLGFTIVGTIPNGVQNEDSSYQDGYIMYRSLKEEVKDGID